MRPVYSLLMYAVQPLLRRKLLRRSRAEPGYAEAIDERFGRYLTSAQPGALWIHAVSLGEARAAEILIRALRRIDPAVRLLLTHGTATGRAEGAKCLGPHDVQAWLPWDTPGAVSRFLDHFRPAAGVLIETEVWPNLVAGCVERGMPLALVNARFSDKSLRQSLRFRALSRTAYSSLSGVWAQTESDAGRLAQVGARVIGVFGNLKFDAQPDPTLLAKGRDWAAQAGRPVVMFASSRDGEEAAFLREALRHRDARVRWLVVPRHPQRFDEVAALAAQSGLLVARRSEWGAAGPNEAYPRAADVWIGDSLGEMPLYYGLADVALLGGSFEPLGGQNLIEAAACGCPLVLGPHTFNFAEAAESACGSGAAVRVSDMAEGIREALALLGDPPRRMGMAAATQRFFLVHAGAADRTAQALMGLVRGGTTGAANPAVSAPAAR